MPNDISNDLTHDLNRELERDFPSSAMNRPLRVNPAPVRQPQQPAGAIQQPVRSSVAIEMARPLVRLAEALDRIDQLASAIEKAEADAAKLLSVVKGKL